MDQSQSQSQSQQPTVGHTRNQQQKQGKSLKKKMCSRVPLRISVIIIGGLQVGLNVGEIICGIFDAYVRSKVTLQLAFGITSIIVSSFALILGILLLVGILKYNLFLVRVWQCVVLFLVVLELVIAGYVIFLLIKVSGRWLYIIWLCTACAFIAVVCVGLFLVSSYIAVKVAEQEEKERLADLEARSRMERDRNRTIRRMRG